MSISSESSDFGDAIPIGNSNAPFVGDVYAGHESQRLDSGVESSIFTNDDNNDSSFAAGNDVFASQPSNYGDYANGGSDGSNLPPPSEMVPEEGLALREWRRDNAVRLEEKEKKEKEILSQVIEEADEYKVEFYRKRVIACENNVVTNREREKSVVASQKKFHDEADKNYWKSIAELIPNEVPSLEKRKGKKGQQETKPSVVALQGPKPGKPTDLSRMRQLLVKLKHDTPAHLKPSPPPIAPTTKDAETVATSTEVVAVA